MILKYKWHEDYITFYTENVSIQFKKKGFRFSNALNALQKHFRTSDIKLENANTGLTDFENFYEEEEMQDGTL